mmetsp:Transcript_6526/g.24249  ORF Transcript_6526/g.24249 Transcript_6526/m.24249 type:complete len:743 (+) Transcript_6526:89-2317(+)
MRAVAQGCARETGLGRWRCCSRPAGLGKPPQTVFSGGPLATTSRKGATSGTREGAADSAMSDNALVLNGKQLRRAAGSKDLDLLRQSLDAWPSHPDEAADCSGKTPLHMAAWTGSLENVELLVASGCNLEAIAVGEHSYGKTPLFFAITRCRDDVVAALLRLGASCLVVNNKGQTPRSLGPSHLSQQTMDLLRAAEATQLIRAQEQELDDNKAVGWRIFYPEFSDGLVYGDRDPRFSTAKAGDVVSVEVINMTTRETRRGNFARNNPDYVRNSQHKQLVSSMNELQVERQPSQAKQRQRRKERKLVKALEGEAAERSISTELGAPAANDQLVKRVEAMWDYLYAKLLAEDDSPEDRHTATAVDSLLAVVTRANPTHSCLPDAIQQLRSWIGNLPAPQQQRAISRVEDALRYTEALQSANKPNSADPMRRRRRLRERLLTGALADNRVLQPPDRVPEGLKRSDSDHKVAATDRASTMTGHSFKPMPPPPQAELLSGQLTASTLRLDEKTHTVRWIDSILGLEQLKRQLRSSGSRRGLLVGLDTEWTETTGTKDITLATIQLAFSVEHCNGSQDADNADVYRRCTSVQCAVIDALPLVTRESEADQRYFQGLLDLLQWLFSAESGVIVVGFAFHGDLTIIQRTFPTLATDLGAGSVQPFAEKARTIDIQEMAIRAGVGAASKVPSLQRVVELWLDGYKLDKTQQCSDWSARPLSGPQLSYAALDAAVLLEILHRMGFTSGHSTD